MEPGTKRIAFGGLALAVIAWGAIEAWWPAAPAPQAEVRNAEGLSAIPEVASRPRTLEPSATATASDPGQAIAAVLVGCFRGTTPAGDAIVERYRVASDGAIEGEFEQTSADGSGVFRERMRIAPSDGVWRYHPSPNGVPAAVSFALVEHGGGALRFANPAHDFPQTIAYRRAGGNLITEVDGIEEGAPDHDSYTTTAEPCR